MTEQSVHKNKICNPIGIPKFYEVGLGDVAPISRLDSELVVNLELELDLELME